VKTEQEVAMVIKRDSLADRICKITLQCPKIASRCRPGQFVRLQALAQKSILPRPLAVYQTDEDGRLEVVVKDTGPNTGLYSRLRPSARIRVSGPHGQPVEIKPEIEKVWLIGGGSGLASLLPLAALLEGKKASVIAGFRTKAEAFGQKDFGQWIKWFSVAIEDSDGQKEWHSDFSGRASDLFSLQLKGCCELMLSEVYACGPPAMEKAVAEICREYGLPCFVFLERLMACGQGACLGCSVPMMDKTVKYVCKDGPVFPAEEVNWNELA